MKAKIKAKIKAARLPKVPESAGHTGKAPGAEWVVLMDASGRVIDVEDHRPERDTRHARDRETE